MKAGYSGTPLARKLGIGAGMRVAVLGEPEGFRGLLDPLPDGVRLRKSIGRDPDIVIVFAADGSSLAGRIDSAAEAVFPDGAVWAAWPKRSARIATDLTEDGVRRLALPLGLVDNKVCAVDETWSALRLVWRRERRLRR